MTILIILWWIAIALIYALQYQIVRDYQPIRYYYSYSPSQEPDIITGCRVHRESIFKLKNLLN